MVFHWRCFSFAFGEVIDYLTPYYTAHSDFGQDVPQMSPDSIRRSTLPSLAERPQNFWLFTHDQLKEATQDFGISSKIGEGGFGSVYKGVIRSLEYPYNKINVAVELDKRRIQGHKQWVTEVNVLGKVEHPNLVKLVGYCAENDENGSHRLLVYEYMPNRSLDDHLSPHSPATLSWERRLTVAHDAACGLTYLHEGMDRQIIFGDFKPSNVLIDSEWNTKLSVVGFARLGPPEGRTHVSTAVVGTKGYAAPEYVQTGRLTSKSDVWSYGIFLEKLITGGRPIARRNSINNHGYFESITCCYCPQKSKLIVDPRLEGQYSQNSVQMLSNIANKCLTKEPKMRPKMSEVLQMVNQVIILEQI